MQYTFLLLDLVQGVTLNVQNKIGQNRSTGSTLICINSIWPPQSPFWVNIYLLNGAF